MNLVLHLSGLCQEPSAQSDVVQSGVTTFLIVQKALDTGKDYNDYKDEAFS